jgi:hypothetical protein
MHTGWLSTARSVPIGNVERFSAGTSPMLAGETAAEQACDATAAALPAITRNLRRVVTAVFDLARCTSVREG